MWHSWETRLGPFSPLNSLFALASVETVRERLLRQVEKQSPFWITECIKPEPYHSYRSVPSPPRPHPIVLPTQPLPPNKLFVSERKQSKSVKIRMFPLILQKIFYKPRYFFYNFYSANIAASQSPRSSLRRRSRNARHQRRKALRTGRALNSWVMYVYRSNLISG